MSDFKTQKALKLKPETLATQVLDGEKTQNLLDLVDFLQDNKLNLKLAAKNAWEVIINNKNNTHTGNQILRRLRIHPESRTWSVNLHYFPEYIDYITDAELINFVWDNIYYKRCHGENCASIAERDIFGKKFGNMCCNEQISVSNLSGKELEHIKTLVITAKRIIENRK